MIIEVNGSQIDSIAEIPNKVTDLFMAEMFYSDAA